MSKLVAFYSRADENYFGGQMIKVAVGNTEKVANTIAEAIGADLFKIEQKVPYSPDYKECVAQAREDLKNNARPELTAVIDNMDQYDEIYLGYPNYCSNMPMAVYTFLESYDFSGKIIHPFMTHEGSGLCSTESQIQKTATGAKVTKGLAVHGSSLDQSGSQIEDWIKN